MTRRLQWRPKAFAGGVEYDFRPECTLLVTREAEAMVIEKGAGRMATPEEILAARAQKRAARG